MSELDKLRKVIAETLVALRQDEALFEIKSAFDVTTVTRRYLETVGTVAPEMMAVIDAADQYVTPPEGTNPIDNFFKMQETLTALKQALGEK